MGKHKAHRKSRWQMKRWHDGFKIMPIRAQAMHPDDSRIRRLACRIANFYLNHLGRFIHE
jgi:hypothetical protein